MSVRQERKALQEIRSLANPHDHAKDVMTAVDMTVEEFSLRYIVSHHAKRQQSKKSRSERERLQREREAASQT